MKKKVPPTHIFTYTNLKKGPTLICNYTLIKELRVCVLPFYVKNLIVNLKYGFCKKYFNRNEPLTSWTFFSRSVLIWKKRGQKWSEVHFYQSNFLQNPYFSSLVSQRFLIAIIISVTSMSLNHFTLSTYKYTLQYLLLYAPTVNSY